MYVCVYTGKSINLYTNHIFIIANGSNSLLTEIAEGTKVHDPIAHEWT